MVCFLKTSNNSKHPKISKYWLLKRYQMEKFRDFGKTKLNIFLELRKKSVFLLVFLQPIFFHFHYHA